MASLLFSLSWKMALINFTSSFDESPCNFLFSTLVHLRSSIMSFREIIIIEDMDLKAGREGMNLTISLSGNEKFVDNHLVNIENKVLISCDSVSPISLISNI